LSSWYEGVMLDSTMATVPITKGSSNMIYKNRVGLGLYGGVSISKKLSDDMQVFAEPYFRYNLSNMTTPNAPYNQKFSIGGISLGVRINLNRQ
jgi:opacity protein-like surface antigen